MNKTLKELKDEIERFEAREQEAKADAAYCAGVLRGLSEAFVEQSMYAAVQYFKDHGPFFAHLRADFGVVESMFINARANEEMLKFAGEKVLVTDVDGSTIAIDGSPYRFHTGYIDGTTIGE